MPVQLETVIVPWFSRQEWLEVFKGTYSDDVNLWKEARDTMLVWQARVRKLPVGVDLTLPLLQAKIVDADPLVDKDVKSIMQGTALQRFVSSVVKLPQTEYYHNQNMHKLAASIGLPAHLVDLRNEIIHGDAGWAGGCTITEALETSYNWIKNYYWYEELPQMKQKQNNVAEAPTVDWKYLFHVLSHYAKVVYSGSCSAAKVNRIKASRSVIKAFQQMYPTNPKKCTNAIITRLLIPTNMPAKLCHYQQSEKTASCGCFFNLNVVKAIDSILSSLLMVEGSTELLLSCLSKVQKKQEISIEWIHLIVESFVELPCKKDGKVACRQHLLQVDKSITVNWKSVVEKLLTIEEEWAASLAVRIMNASETSFSESQVKQTANLLKLIKFIGKDTAKQTAEIFDGVTDADLYDVDTLLDVSHELSSDAMKVSQKIRASVSPSVTCARTPLGILPHQIGNKQFYKELLLHYPGDRNNEPPLKRKKT